MGSSGEDVSSGDQTKVDDAHDATSPMPGTPLQSGDSKSSEEEEEQEGMISDSTGAAKSTDEDKPAATSTSRDSQGVAPLSLTPLLVKHGKKISALSAGQMLADWTLTLRVSRWVWATRTRPHRPSVKL